MSLEKYQAKRDFEQTSEPKGRRAKKNPKPIFVVQEHHARRLHYDFRLEADGVLKSWAVPKEPSLDPSQKRLAVHVEDHPLDYAKFKGTIPEGQYGAGTVDIWDHGTYENILATKPQPQSISEGVDSGRLEFALHGRKLRGKFALIRLRGSRPGKDNWLLIKMKDEFAKADGSNHPLPHGRSSKDSSFRARRIKRTLNDKSQRGGSAPPREFKDFTNLQKVMFREDGITKADVLEFYWRIADQLLPYLRDRPATLERLPDGIGDSKPHFWQKNTPASYPDWIERIDIPSETGKKVAYVLVNSLPTLLYLVNQGTLTFHVQFSRVQALERPDFVLFDLDPGEATFSDAVVVAKQLFDILTKKQVKAFVKTSGKTGLHILTPWDQKGGHDEARNWALELANQVVDALPDQATTVRSKAKRGGRVYVDVMQNAKGRHAVPPYVLRPVPKATVSMPLEWQRLTSELDPSQFSLKTVFSFLAKRKRDPMAELLPWMKQ